jgi:hypothetical protein
LVISTKMKAYDLFISKSALKMLRRDHGYSRHLMIDRWVFGKCLGHSVQWARYFTTPDARHVKITLVCRYASRGKLYTIARLIEYEFETKMNLYVCAATDAGMPAYEAIRTFLEKYDVSEEDLKFETAVKRWQRYQNKEYQRDLIPLW